MKSMGRTMDQMYPSAVDGKKEQHPEVSVPKELLTSKYSVGDKCHIEFQAIIESMDKNTVRLKLLKGDEVESEKDETTEDENDTLLGKK